MAESIENDETETMMEKLLQQYKQSVEELSHHPIIHQNNEEELKSIQEILRTEGDRMNEEIMEWEQKIHFWKTLYTQIHSNLCSLFKRSKPPREPLQVDSFKKSAAKHKQNLDNLTKVIEQTLETNEELESNVKDQTVADSSSKAGWGQRLVHYLNFASDLLDQAFNRLVKMYAATSIDLQGTQSTCTSCSDVKDTEWELVVPDAVALSVNGNVKYRFTAAPGSYECTVTGLRWESSSEVELEYCWSNWELVSEVLEREQYHPGGPLLDITVIRGTLNAVHLPHFLCLGSESSLRDAVRVFHDADVGASFETCSLSRFHAKLLQPTFSPKGVLVKNGFRVKAHCEILIYHVLAAPLTLHIYIIPHDIKMKEAVEKERSDKCVKILKPNPKSSLQMKSWYKLKTLQKTKQSHYDSEITPTSLKLRYNTATTNFFEVYISNPEEDFYLQLTTEKDNEVVWEVPIRGNDFSVMSGSLYGHKDCSSSHTVCFVDEYMKELIQRVRLVSPIADDLKLLIGDEKYSIIRGCTTPQEQMRTLYSFLAGGQELKVKFYESLQKNEPLIVEELQRQECP
ncbi:NACHT, LRR and PYD domains-containing protein 1 homolog isoform X2 [Colossoma macropomum]|uniref:NACHT, LRR and PYD domains-containing protein 1 homolog isoform X2 n=1 Tax=Colossoma macropomum TaxID=42526 RepID=UPI0018652D86|nr:NACHT, LRR and PYD domains-containing protein 1 homolog isoform X2 [Colossoma macropomum]